MPLVQSRAGFRDEADLVRWASDHYDAVFRFCARRVGADRAADAAQETFVTAQRSLRRFRGDSSPLTWLLGIAHNHCRRASRRDAARPTVVLCEHDGAFETEGALIDRQALARALADLSRDHREAVVMHEIEGRSHEEIAEILGVPVGTVKSRLHYAFKALRASLFGGEGL